MNADDFRWCDAARKRNTVNSKLNIQRRKDLYIHVIPSGLIPHLAELYCECMPVTDPDDEYKIIHQDYHR